MKFERLTPPGWQLPDLVAFNQRVHEWVDPWWRHRWVRLAAWAGAALFALFAAMWIYFAAGLPSSQSLLAYQPPLPTNVRGYDGDPVQTFARERRVDLSYDEFPPLLIHAFISAEDKEFFHHHGIDYTGFLKAVFNYTTHLGRGRVAGGSTITQQVAKYLLRDSSYNVGRKAREAILAFRLEDTLSKQQILELYFNSIFLGRNAYGVQAASRAYFDKDVDELTLPEAAYLAILPKAPSNYDPVRATQKALDRRNYVLREMYRNGYITEDQWHTAASSPLGTIRYGSNDKFRQQGGFFMEEVRRELIKQFGEDAKDGANSLYSGGLWVRSSMDPKMQDPAAQALRNGLVKFGGASGWKDLGMSIDLSKDWAGELDRAAVGTGFPDWLKAVVISKDAGAATIGFTNGSTASLPASGASMPVRGQAGAAFDALKPGMVIIVKQVSPGSFELKSVPAISGGMLVEEVHTGRVLAMQGGFDVVGSSYNRAIQALRQPGSAFKPIVYVTALQNGFTPATIELDAPYCIDQGPGIGQKCFVNFDHRSAGPHTLRWGLEQSRNLMTVRAAANIGMPKITDTARKLGVGDYPNYLSIALGAGDTTVLRLVNAYAILANQGRSVKPTTIDFVQDRNGKVIYRTDNRCALMGNCNATDWNGGPMPRPPSRTRQLVDPMAAFQMVHVMEGVIIRGTATVLRDLNRPLFGKTGTTNGPTNVWFVGGTPDIVAGVYLGYDNPKPMGSWAQGGRISAPIWKDWAQTALKDQPKVPFVAPPGIRWVRIDRASGKPVFGSFPTTEDPKSDVIWEAFQPQTEAVHTGRSTFGDPYSPQYLQLWEQAGAQAQQGQQQPGPGAPPASAPVATLPEARPSGLPTTNAL
ncbi:MAG TPA: PBP1A family penicillin-binding protein [Sphingomicrobium sp.]|nr:PBP1A family penicillin-binding protein [Sphingomicrobium sp.]